MVRKLTLQPHLQLFHAATSQLADQLAQGFGELEMGLELLHHLWGEARDVDGAAGWQAQEHIPNLLSHVNGHIFLGLFRGRSQVGREDQALLNRPQGGCGLQGLIGIDIEGRAADHPVLNGLGDRRLINDSAAGAIDDARRGLHRFQQFRIDQVFGIRGAGQVQADVVGFGKQGRQRHQPHLHVLGPLRRHKRVVGHHIHAHGLGHPGHVGADLAEPHHPKFLLVELVAHIFLAVPAAGHGARVGMGHMARQREHQGQGMLCRGNGVALRGIHHNHAPLGRRGHIDVVDPHAGTANDAEFVGRFDDLGGHLGA